MQYNKDASDGDGPIKRLNDTMPNDTADITPHRTTRPAKRMSAKQNPGTRMHDTGPRNPPDKPHTCRSGCVVNESAPDNPQTHLSPVRKPDRGRHATAVRTSTTPASAGVVLQVPHTGHAVLIGRVLNMQMGNQKARLGRPQIYV
ncbi:hypothetical protein BS47DRAFT_1368298 [Hydnum rufescens UP504]|uniref:Uncharacterized protein n=1 Tax=Hydnum rufescens UP504 TaxID=1448309 RepID=A0A9P6AG79_9AGAM|nr:hypothetical protein BS47DRAFT_1368298 [Hydnum rufescens UP504]